MKGLLKTIAIVAVSIMIAACSNSSTPVNNESNGLYRIYVGGKYGFIDENGIIVIDPQYSLASFSFQEDLCFAKTDERTGLINKKGEFVAELDNSIIWCYGIKDGLGVCLSENQKVGIIDNNGVVGLPLIYKEIEYDDFGFIVEDTNGNMGYINKKLEFIIPCKNKKVIGFQEGLMAVAPNNKFGYVDTLGVWALDTIYDVARAFGDNGIVRVQINGKWCFIDKKGNEIPELNNYDDVLSGFVDNRAFVKRGDTILLIDETGKEINIIEADSVYGYHERYAIFKRNGKYGSIDTTGAIVIPAKYDKMNSFGDGYSRIELNGKYGVVDSIGAIKIDINHNRDAGKINDASLFYGQDLINGEYLITYYDIQGNVIWKDIPGNSFTWPSNPTKADFIAYFDSRLSDLDPIEGVYYATFNRMAVNRDNDHASSNGSSSQFYAVVRNPSKNDEYMAYVIDENKPWQFWVKKFVQIGESNTYAVVNRDENSTWSEDGKVILEDPYKFEVTLRQGGNNYYNWYVECEFIKDYPSAEVFEQVQKAEWTGSGFAIADGYLVTNYHVTKGSKSVYIKGVRGNLEESYKGFVVASDRDHDLSIIKIVDKKFEGFGEIPYCIGKSIPDVGDGIFVLGYPLTNTMGQEVKLTDGIISAASGYKGDKSMYQISAALQPGNSGGPLFDAESNVIGIVCAKHLDAENANYAIKVSYLFSLVNNSGLGIQLADNNKVKTKSLSQTVKQVKSFVYLIECSSH